ncbi:elongator complex protein 2 isoform X1 [Selaginella moellendorffii]|uniref:elongator complex protein 2 isoform X1 n=1 Tax=Selaginella moellendorffii TaxID=88036 RepID=UPI000D1D0941|nr:elongator complex protein 2 isoform X1 [Selaginella moellendorffii]|eukprot:XP_024542072.1 elongator complex protein 2 isoform X1 [Selaginella moellendorffii]
MAMARVEAVFVSAGCNKTVKAAAWGRCDLVAFATHSSVGIFSPKASQILVSLSGHKSSVNCVEWLDYTGTDAGECFILSGSADGVVILWSFVPSQKKWRIGSQATVSKGGSVTCIASMMISSTEALFATSTSDGGVCVWSASLLPGDCSLLLVDTVEMVVSRPVVAVAMARLPGISDITILAVGSLDNTINIYAGSKLEKFTHACKLKGHQDWIRGLDFSGIVHQEDGVESLFLASSSQDRNIRIWKIRSRSPGAASRGPSLRTYIEGPVFRAGKETWQISLESLLVGHEDWVYSVRWQPLLKNKVQPMSVLSSSMDKTMMVWRPEAKSGIWMNEVTVGELGQTAFGFYGGVWSPGGDAILAHGFNGSFHLWKEVSTGWMPQLVPSGHFGPVVDVAWASNGQFLLTASHDQTTRVFTSWNKDAENSTWHEVARPQVHGHDMNCLAIIRGKGNYRYVSGADEKVARVFEAPTAFLDTLDLLTSSSGNEEARQGVQILGANMSALGLSQKPIYTQGLRQKNVFSFALLTSFSLAADANQDSRSNAFDSEYVPKAVPSVLTKPPLEEQLVQNTLWPESHKLYGHGNELYSMCSNHGGEILATACKAQTPSVAEIWLWETKSWRPITQLRSHSLTVTQMEFSHDDRFLLSVSRDRHLSLFRITTGTIFIVPAFQRLLVKLEAHKRIVWTCSWSPHDNRFATGSRDKSVKIWSIVEQEGDQEQEQAKVELLSTLPSFASSVTALAWGSKDLLAVGMESGMIELWSVAAKQAPSLVTRFDSQLCHAAAVNRLCWSEDQERSRLASCGADHAVKLFQVNT